MNRIVLCGYPKCGKTTMAHTLAKELGCRVFSFDSMIQDYDWSPLSMKAAEIVVGTSSPIIFEGVQGFRVLQKALALDATKFIDKVIVLTKPFVELSEGQLQMVSNIDGDYQKVEKTLTKRGIEIEIR